MVLTKKFDPITFWRVKMNSFRVKEGGEMRRVLRIAVLFMPCILLACGGGAVHREHFKGSVEEYRGTIAPGQWMRDIPLEYIDGGQVRTAKIQIYFPTGYARGKAQRTLIALHNTGGDQRDWERNSRIVGYANTYGFAVVCPGMGSTIYETNYYPETTRKWDGIPGGKWVGEVLVGFIRQRFGLATERKRTGIVGISSGARGAVLISESYPEMFGATAALSGYYDTLSMTKSTLLSSVYGEYAKFEERWKKEDNTIELARNLKDTPVFLAHGKDDAYYNYEQSRFLAVRLLMLRSSHLEAVRGSVKDAAALESIAKSAYQFEMQLMKNEYHNWPFWNYVTPRMMEFFDRRLSRD